MSRQVGARKRQKYDVSVLEKVVDLIKSNTISMNQASKVYGIPKSTIHDHVHSKYQTHSVGVKPVLSREEDRISKWAVHIAKIGFGRTRQELSYTIKKIIDEDGRQTPFKGNKPGKKWLKGFFARHPALTIRTTMQIGKERALISPEKVENWFTNFRKYIEEEVGDKELLTDPSRIYNADESGFSLCQKGNQVIGYKGAPVVYHFGNSDKTQLTVMAAVSATAHYVPPMIIFPGQRFSYDPLEGFPEAAIGRSDNGWMDTEVFSNWLLNVFIPAVNERRVKKPVLLLIDGHKTHVTMQASDICVENGIELYCLLEHASHIMQPLDLRLFSSLKRTWRQAVRDWQSEHIGEFVTKRTFAGVFKQAWQISTTVEAAVKGFIEAGLFPLDPAAVLRSVKLDPSMLFRQTDTNQSCDSTKQRPKVLPRSDDVDAPDDQIQKSIEQTVNDTDQHSTETTPEALDTEIGNADDIDIVPSEGNSITTPVPEMSTPVKASNSVPTDQISPFSKYLTFPESKASSKRKRPTQPSMPKAITGAMYREILQKKLKEKEDLELAKKKRQEEREKKKKERQEEQERKKVERERKKQQKQQQKAKKREMREKLLKSIEDESESDDAVDVGRGNCYECEDSYGSDFMQCSNCDRCFHVACAAGQIEDGMDDILPFECKYC